MSVAESLFRTQAAELLYCSWIMLNRSNLVANRVPTMEQTLSRTVHRTMDEIGAMTREPAAAPMTRER